MFHKLLITSLVLILSACQSPPHPPDNTNPERSNLEQFCETHDCRRDVTLRLNTDEGRIEEVLPLFWPAVMDDHISLLPGDALFVEAELAGATVVGFKAVDTIRHPENTLTIRFGQMEDGMNMVLNVHNPFRQRLKYRIDLVDFAGEAHPTSSCPVMAGGDAFEMWPHPIPEMILTDFHLLAASVDMACMY